MFLSILFVILFIICLLGVVLYPKCEGQINGLKAAVMAMMAIFCYQAIMAFLYNRIGIRVDLKSTAASMLAADILLWLGILKKRKPQKVFFRISDLVSLIVLAVFILAVSLHMFTGNLRLSYVNTDPANHFKFAMCIVNYGVLDSIYFSAFIDAIFIELFAPVITMVSYYKAFIIADIFMHVLEVWMFYVLAITISDRKITRILAPFLTMCYFFGYPAYSYMTGGFVYWSNGVMILIFIVYGLLLLERHEEIAKKTGVLLFLGAYANSCCNKLFIPVNYFALFVALVAILLKKRKGSINKRLLAAVLLAVFLIGGGAALLFWKSWGGSLQNMIDYVSVGGGIYRAMYAELIFFVPAMLLVFYHAFYKRSCSKTISLMAVCMILCAVGMYIFWYNYMMSTYYYYKIYYNLWLFGWLLVVVALDIMGEKKQLSGFFAYGGMLVVIGVISFTDYDTVMLDYNEEYNGSYATSQLFSLYHYNRASLLTDYEQYELSAVVLDVYAYAVENTFGEYVPIISAKNEYRYWFDGMKAQDSDTVRADRYSLMEIVQCLDMWGVNKIMVVKTDDFYLENEDYFKRCVPIYENQEAALLTFAGTSWSEAYGATGTE